MRELRTLAHIPIIILMLLFLMPVAAAAETVYVDGVGTDANCYATLSEAFAAVDAGGKVVLTAPIENSTESAVTLPTKDGVVTITSVCDGVDYAEKNGAYLGIGRTLNLSSPVIFENITLRQTSGSTVYGNIYACGNFLTFGSGVTTVADETTGLYPSVYGGSSSGALRSDTHLAIASGTWNNVFGGSYQTLYGDSLVEISGGTFSNVYGGCRAYNFEGNSTVNFSGGTILKSIAGGNGPDGRSFTGNSTLNLTGGTVEYLSTAAGVVGGSVGASGGEAYTFSGTIALNIGGNVQIYSTVLGASRYTNIKTEADITVKVFGNAVLYRHLYGGGYGNVSGTIDVTLSDNAQFVQLASSSTFVCAGANSGTVTGDVSITCDLSTTIYGNIYGGGYSGNVEGNSTATLKSGTITVYFSAGSRSGNVSGTATTICLGGTLSNSAYGMRGCGGDNGTITGAAHMILDGAAVAGSATLGSVGAGSTLTLKNGSVGTVSDKAVIDLSDGGTLSLGGAVNADAFTGGGTLILAASASLTTDSLIGETTLEIIGTPVANHTYIKVTDPAANGAVAYTSADDEVLTRTIDAESVCYTMTYPQRFETTHIRIFYYNPNGEAEIQPQIVLYSGARESAVKITSGIVYGSENGHAYAEVDLGPGLYYFKVYYDGGSDYVVKRFWLDGKSEVLTYDCPFEPYVADSYMENIYTITTDQVLQNFYGTDDLVGYTELTTPTFTLHADDRRFMSNKELCAYVESLAQNCPYLYLYILDLDTEQNRMPVLLFTKDTIPEGATLEEAAAIVRGGGVRDILMASSGKHGNEPAGVEGILAYAADLCGEYGEEVLNSLGAVVLIPAVSVDNLQRFKRNYTDGVNPNRDLLSLGHEDSQKEAYVYNLFMPTVRVDCHEDTSGTNGIDESDYSHNNMADVCFQYTGVPNTPLTDIAGMIDGTNPLLTQGRRSMVYDLIDRVSEVGLRGALYQWSYYHPGTSDAYGAIRGSYGILIEVMRIWSGKSHYDRAVWAMSQGLKAVTAEIIEADGAMSKEVAEARAAAAVTTFDPNNVFVTAMVTGQSGLNEQGPYPSVYLDGTWKDANYIRTYNRFDTATAYRSMPTAYVLPADTSNIDAILEKIGAHGLFYTKIQAGSTLTLRRYTLAEQISCSEAESVTFPNGAYVFLTDTSDSYLMAYLFEPDSYTASDTDASLYQMGLLSSSNTLYRSETDYMRMIIADMTEKDAVAGDCNGDSIVNLADVLTALRALVNGAYLPAADLNGDGIISLSDILKLLRLCAG